MPMFTIETGYRLSIYRLAHYEAETIEEARRRALADDDWSGERPHYETSGETRVPGVWLDADSAYRSFAPPFPTQSDATIARSLGLRLFAGETAGVSSEVRVGPERGDSAWVE